MLLWDVRENMEKNHRKKLDDIKDKFKNKKSYFIHAIPNWTDPWMDTIKTTYLIRDKEPPKMLGSMLYYIDNEKGLEELKWALPMDVIVPQEYLDKHNSVENVAKSAKDIKPAIVVS